MPVVRIEDTDLAYVEAGSGPVLLLVHGSLCDYRYWSAQFQTFSRSHRVIALSLRHYWPERWDGRGDDFTIERHVRDVGGFIAALGGGPVDLCGHSRGGSVAFRVAQHFPDAVRRLILAEPGGPVETEENIGTPTPVSAVLPEVADRIARGDVDGGLALFVDAIGGTGAWAQAIEGFKGMARDNARTLIAQAREKRPPITLAEIGAIRAPTLLIGGARTAPPFPGTLSAFEAALAQVRRVKIPHAGHPMNVENADAFNAAVLEFLAET